MSSDDTTMTAPEAEESQASGSPSPEPTPSGDPVKELRQKVTQQGEDLKTAKRMVAYLKERHPDVFQDTFAHLTGAESNGNYDKELGEILATFEDPKAVEALQKAFGVLEKKVEARLSPQLRAAQSVAQSAAEERGLRAAGVDLYDAEFNEVRTELEDRRYQLLLREDAEEAAQYLGERFLARRGSAKHGSARSSTREAAAASSTTGTRSADAGERFEVTPDMSITEIYEQVKAGKRPK